MLFLNNKDADLAFDKYCKFSQEDLINLSLTLMKELCELQQFYNEKKSLTSMDAVKATIQVKYDLLKIAHDALNFKAKLN